MRSDLARRYRVNFREQFVTVTGEHWKTVLREKTRGAALVLKSLEYQRSVADPTTAKELTKSINYLARHKKEGRLGYAAANLARERTRADLLRRRVAARTCFPALVDVAKALYWATAWACVVRHATSHTASSTALAIAARAPVRSVIDQQRRPARSPRLRPHAQAERLRPSPLAHGVTPR